MKLLFNLLIAALILSTALCSSPDYTHLQKKEIKNLTMVAYSGVNYFYKLYKKGFMTKKEAKNNAKALVKSLRYGRENNDYFWINDLNLKMIMHPLIPALKGKNLSNYKDHKGKSLFKEIKSVCEKNGEGFVDFHWQYKDNKEKIVPKIAFVKLFKPWKWIIGTSTYLEE